MKSTMIAGLQTPPASADGEAAGAGAAPMAAKPATTSSSSNEYRAVQGGEQYSGEKLMIGAYAAIWVVLMAWIYLLWRKQAALGERLDGLERTIDRAAAAIEKNAAAPAKTAQATKAPPAKAT